MKTLKIAFTGARPGTYLDYNIMSARNKVVIEALETFILRLNKQCPIEEVYCGGALGFDTLSFIATAKVNKALISIIDGKSYHQIVTNLCIPYENQPNKWKDKDKAMYDKCIEKADIVHYVDTIQDYQVKGATVGEHSNYKLMKRNMFMVDNANLVISFWDGKSRGGTRNCVEYALKKGKQVININAETHEIREIKSIS